MTPSQSKIRALRAHETEREGLDLSPRMGRERTSAGDGEKEDEEEEKEERWP